MIVLGLDACLGRCSVALLRNGECLSHRSEAMERGHIERLSPMVAEILADAGINPSQLDIVGVTCGPGGFTGARLGVAFARGLALSTPARAVGVSTLEALAFPFPQDRTMAVLDGRRGEVFAQVLESGQQISDAVALKHDAIAAFVQTFTPTRIVGSGCPIVSEALADNAPELPAEPDAGIDPRDVALIAAADRATSLPPSPIYLRAPDAKPSAPAILTAP